MFETNGMSMSLQTFLKWSTYLIYVLSMGMIGGGRGGVVVVGGGGGAGGQSQVSVFRPDPNPKTPIFMQTNWKHQ